MATPVKDKDCDTSPQRPPDAKLSPRCAQNLQEFMKRVDLKGLEAFAFCEAYAELTAITGNAPV